MPLIWIGIGLGALASAALVLLYLLLARMRELELRAAPLEQLTKIEAHLIDIVQQPQDLDLRRLEHVLIDIRDGQRRVEARMLAVLESLQATRAGEASDAPPATAPSAVDRITSRLLALGFERIEFLTAAEELPDLFESDGDVLVEARRSGVPYKGRVALRDGGIGDVQLRPSYQIFP